MRQSAILITKHHIVGINAFTGHVYFSFFRQKEHLPGAFNKMQILSGEHFLDIRVLDKGDDTRENHFITIFAINRSLECKLFVIQNDRCVSPPNNRPVLEGALGFYNHTTHVSNEYCYVRTKDKIQQLGHIRQININNINEGFVVKKFCNIRSDITYFNCSHHSSMLVALTKKQQVIYKNKDNFRSPYKTLDLKCEKIVPGEHQKYFIIATQGHVISFLTQDNVLKSYQLDTIALSIYPKISDFFAPRFVISDSILHDTWNNKQLLANFKHLFLFKPLDKRYIFFVVRHNYRCELIYSKTHIGKPQFELENPRPITLNVNFFNPHYDPEETERVGYLNNDPDGHLNRCFIPYRTNNNITIKRPPWSDM